MVRWSWWDWSLS